MGQGEFESKLHEKKIDRADDREVDDVFQGASQARRSVSLQDVSLMTRERLVHVL